ncbi:MAG: fibronectin type III domain-containing protein, partial [Clostridiales bacterium]|nr:fibronectin type III domain-containing protein [Clostridiales bacterium]
MTIEKGQNITLNLNGKTITGGTSANYNSNDTLFNPVIDNSGNLTIIDNKGGGVVTSYEGSTSSYSKPEKSNNFAPQQTTIWNHSGATMVLSGGTYQSDRAGYVLRNNGTMTINSGVTVKYLGSHEIHSSTILNGYNDNEGKNEPIDSCKLTINGGTFTGYYAVIKNGDLFSDLVINGGTFTAEAKGEGWNVIRNGGAYNGYKYKCTATINGGTFNGAEDNQNNVHKTDLGLMLKKDPGKDNSNNYYPDADVNDFVITGGAYTADPSRYVASGYVVTHSGEYYYVSPVPPSKTNTDTTTTAGGSMESTTTTTPDITSSDSGNVAVNVDNTEGNKIVNDVKNAETTAAANGKTVEPNVVVSSAGDTDATKVSVSLPASTVNTLANDTNATVTLETSVGDVTLDQKALDAVAATAGDTGSVTLVIEKVAKDTLPQNVQTSLGENSKVIDLKLVTDKGTVTDFNGGTATIRMPVPEGIDPADVFCIYLDDNNVAHKIDSKVVTVDGKAMIEFTTGHNSHYAIVSKATGEKLVTKAAAPKNIKAKVSGKNSIKVTWSKSKGANSYKVYMATKKAGKYTSVGTTTGTYKVVRSLKSNKTYYFKVAAVNSAGNSAMSKAASAKIKVVTKVKDSVSFTLSNIKGNNVSVHWKVVKGAVGYQIANNATPNSKLEIQWTGSNGNCKYTSMHKTKGQTYKFKMRYYKVKDGKKVYSSWTKVK